MFFVSKQPHLYQDIGYETCECCGILHRGPAVDLSQKYICCVGNSYTFGRFVLRPYPEILSELTGIQVLNLGFGHLTPIKLNRNPILKRIIAKSYATVAQFRLGEWDGLEIQPEIKLNWGRNPFDGLLNVPFDSNSERPNQHYPNQESHAIMAGILKSLLT